MPKIQNTPIIIGSFPQNTEEDVSSGPLSILSFSSIHMTK
ncbi:hypothetical protein BSM4216_0043 [Bacillus smithii]|nr:hypothetical protein BSM4216_0043 [Bacillus smithii]